MKVSSYYPVIAVSDVSKTADFYETHFGFERAYDSDWYVHLRMPDDEKVNLAVLESTHETIPEGYRKNAQGMLLNFETDDVDAIYARMTASDVEILQPLRDEAFGQRHFIMRDPAGGYDRRD